MTPEGAYIVDGQVVVAFTILVGIVVYFVLDAFFNGRS